MFRYPRFQAPLYLNQSALSQTTSKQYCQILTFPVRFQYGFSQVYLVYVTGSSIFYKPFVVGTYFSFVELAMAFATTYVFKVRLCLLSLEGNGVVYILSQNRSNLKLKSQIVLFIPSVCTSLCYFAIAAKHNGMILNSKKHRQLGTNCLLYYCLTIISISYQSLTKWIPILKSNPRTQFSVVFLQFILL